MPFKDPEVRRQYVRDRRARQAPEQRAAYNKQCNEYGKKNRAKRNAYQREWIARNRAKKSAYSMKGYKKWKARDPKAVLEMERRYRKKNAIKINYHNRKRKDRKKNNGGSHTLAQWLQKVNSLGWKCFYCPTILTIETLTKDHVIPFKRGGRDDIENVVPACLSCNCSKSAMTGDEFIQYRKSKTTYQ